MPRPRRSGAAAVLAGSLHRTAELEARRRAAGLHRPVVTLLDDQPVRPEADHGDAGERLLPAWSPEDGPVLDGRSVRRRRSAQRTGTRRGSRRQRHAGRNHGRSPRARERGASGRRHRRHRERRSARDLPPPSPASSRRPSHGRRRARPFRPILRLGHPDPPPAAILSAETSRARAGFVPEVPSAPGTLSAVKRYHVTTFGCQMNAHDSERIKGMLESLGLGEAASQDEADVVVFNTCTIREKPDQRLAAHLAQAKALKDRDPDARDRRRRLLRRGAARADLRAVPVRRRRLRAGIDPAPRRVARRRRRGASERVRHRRGASLLRRAAAPPRAAVPGLGAGLDGLQLEVRVLHRPGGARPRAVAAGPATSSPRSPRSPPTACARSRCSARTSTRTAATFARTLRTGFAELLRACDAVDGIERIRFTSPHPKDFRPDVIEAMAECAAVCEHAHLPLQSGSTRILKRMRRTYSRERYRALVAEHARRDPRPRADHRPDRRLPRRDRGRLPARRSRSSRRSASTARSRSSSRRAAEPRRRRCPTRSPTRSSASGSSG